MTALRFSLGALVLAASLAVAAGPPMVKPPRPIDREALNDQLDYLFLASDRPVLIRLHLRLGDKPYAQAWSAWMDKMFDWFDRNSNGSLEPGEVARLTTSQFLASHLQGAIGGGGGNQIVPMVSLDTNKDGKVSRDEFRAYYRNNSLGALRLNQSNFQATEADKINKAIYSRINTKKDGKLTPADAARLPELLAKLDENEDELLAISEVNTQVDMGYYAVPTVVAAAVPSASDFGLIDIKATPAADLARKLLKTYDRDGDGRLSAAEAGLDKADFAALDRDADGKLSSAELAGFFSRHPDLTVRARVGALGATNTVLSGLGQLFGQKKSPADRAEVLTSTKLPSPLAKKVKRVNGDNLALSLGDTDISVQVNQGYGAQSGARQFYLRQFDNIANKQESVDRKQVMNDFYLGQLFTQADRNADGKLTRKELAAWLDLLGEGGGAFVNLSLNDLGRSVFQVLDANRDNQLSIREMRTAWDRIKPLCKDKAFLRTSDLRRGVSVTVQQGFANFGQPAAGFAVALPAPTAQARPGNAPLWFRKMDRNNDGDLSPKEWLGTDEDFREIDTDGDGLISAAEARAFEAKAREAEKDASKKGAGAPAEKGGPVK